MNTQCLVIGDLNIDLILNRIEGFPKIDHEIIAEDYDVVIGGSGGIFTAVLSMLGIKTAIISTIGNDMFGKSLTSKLKENNASVSRLIINEKEKTGITIYLSYDSGKSQTSSVKLIKNLKFNDFTLKDLSSIEHVHFSSYYVMDSLRESYVEIIKKIKSQSKEITFSMDTNDDPSNEWKRKIYKIFDHIDILFLNKREALNISREQNIKKAISRLSRYVEKVVIKAGKEGYFAKIDGKDYRGFCQNKKNKNFLDSTGAGDNFDAAFIFGFLNNIETSKTLRFADYCAEKSVEYSGGVGNIKKFKIIKGHPIYNSLKKGDGKWD